ncbi:MAG: putative transposase [Paraglaciecola sp.]|jgi:putative transposase
MEYRTGAHTKYKLEYHFVWVTKYRYQMLQGDLAIRLRELVRQICGVFEIEIIRGVASKDHVHILVSAPLTMSPSEIMRRIKGRTSAKLFQEFPHIKNDTGVVIFGCEGIFM